MLILDLGILNNCMNNSCPRSTTWRRTVEKERNKAGWKGWEVAKAVAQDRRCWSDSWWRHYAPTGVRSYHDNDDMKVY